MTQQQRASILRGVRMVSSRQAAVQRSRAARVQATNQKRRVALQTLLTPAMTVGQASYQTQKPRSKKHRTVPSAKTTQPESLRAAARETQLARSRAERASVLAQRRGQAAVPPPSPAQRGKAAHALAAAHSRQAHAKEGPAQAPCVQHSHGALKRFSRRLGDIASERLRAAARGAQRVQSRTQRAAVLALKRGQTTGSTPAAAQDGTTSGPHNPTTQRAQQQASLQVHAESASATMHQPPYDSTAAVQQYTVEPQQGSPGMPKRVDEHEAPDNVETPATPQPHPPPTAELAGGATQSSTEAEELPQQQEKAQLQEPGGTSKMPLASAQPSHSSGPGSTQSAVSSDKFPQVTPEDRWALNFLRDFTGETTLPPRQLQHPKHATTQGIRPQADILQESGPEARAASSGATEGDYPQGSGSDAWGRSHAAMGSEVGHGQGGGQAQADQQQPLAIPVQHRSQAVSAAASQGSPAPAPASAGPLFGGEQLITAEMAIALLKAFYAEDEECHRPGSALSRKAARNAGTVEAWGPVRYAERFQIFRATEAKKHGKKMKCFPIYERPPASRLSAVSPASCTVL